MVERFPRNKPNRLYLCHPGQRPGIQYFENNQPAPK